MSDTLCWFVVITYLLLLYFPVTVWPETLSSTHLIYQWIQGSVQETWARVPMTLHQDCQDLGNCKIKKQDKYSTYEQITIIHIRNTYCELTPLKIKYIHICMYASIHRFNSTLNLFHHCLTLDTEVLRFPMAARCTLVINAWSDMLIMHINMFHKPVQQLLQRPSLADWH